jgi:hypothetical protein
VWIAHLSCHFGFVNLVCEFKEELRLHVACVRESSQLCGRKNMYFTISLDAPPSFSLLSILTGHHLLKGNIIYGPHQVQKLVPQCPYKGIIPILGWTDLSARICFWKNWCPAATGPLRKIQMTKRSVFSTVLTLKWVYSACLTRMHQIGSGMRIFSLNFDSIKNSSRG